MSMTGSIRLTKEEEEEMAVYGFKSASEYIRYKLGKVTPEELEERSESLAGFIEKNEVKLIQPQKSEGMSKDDAVRMAKLEFELKLAQSENKELRSQVQESLGSISLTVAEQVNRIREAEELNGLRTKASMLEKEVEDYKKKYKKTKKELKNAKGIKELAPLAQPFLGAIASGVSKWQSGGGFAGLFDGISEGLNSSGTAKLNAVDEQALSLGKDIQAMFTQDEFSKVMTVVSILGTDKALIDQMPKVLDLLQKSISVNNSMSGNDGNEISDED